MTLHIDDLRRVRPSQLVIIDDDGERRTLPVPARRNRWQTVQRSVDAMNWSRVELLDDAGAILHVAVAPNAPVLTADDRMASALVAAQRQALDAHCQSTKTLTDALVATSKDNSQRMGVLDRALERAYVQIEELQRQNRDYAETIGQLQSELEISAKSSTADNAQLLELGGRVITMMGSKTGAQNVT